MKTCVQMLWVGNDPNAEDSMVPCGQPATRVLTGAFRHEAYCDKHAKLALLEWRKTRARQAAQLAETETVIAELEGPGHGAP